MDSKDNNNNCLIRSECPANKTRIPTACCKVEVIGDVRNPDV